MGMLLTPPENVWEQNALTLKLSSLLPSCSWGSLCWMHRHSRLPALVFYSVSFNHLALLNVTDAPLAFNELFVKKPLSFVVLEHERIFTLVTHITSDGDLFQLSTSRSLVIARKPVHTWFHCVNTIWFEIFLRKNGLHRQLTSTLKSMVRLHWTPRDKIVLSHFKE